MSAALTGSARSQIKAIADRMVAFALTAKMPASAETVKKWAREIEAALKREAD